MKTWQFYGLVFLFICSAQSGLLVIGNATPILNRTAQTIAFLAANAWILSSYGGFVNAIGRVGTGVYSDRIGRLTSYRINSAICAVFLFLTPAIMASGNVPLLFLAVGIAYWQYGGGLALLPALTADFFGAKTSASIMGWFLSAGVSPSSCPSWPATSRTGPAASTAPFTSPGACW